MIETTTPQPEGGVLGQEQAAAVARRRNFAIISHPDAGKTTLTEKLLLYGGAIQQAGAVRGAGAAAAGHLRLDGAGEAAWHLHHLHCAAV